MESGVDTFGKNLRYNDEYKVKIGDCCRESERLINQSSLVKILTLICSHVTNSGSEEIWRGDGIEHVIR